MKKFTTILISCSLALAAGAMAQQEEASQPPNKKQAEGKHPAKEARPAKNAAKEARPANETKPESARKEHAATKAPGQTKGAPEPQSTSESPAATNAGKDAPANGKQQAEQSKKKEHNAPNAPATANKPAAPTPASASAPSQAPAAPQANKVNAQAKKPDPQAVQAIKAQHANFRAQPRPEQVPAVTFNQSYRIQGADQWQGEQYGVFRSYHPELHDQGWYRSRYDRVELIGGGYYYWNAGYWYPAWGYDRSAQYYAYDGPIYVGSHAEPPDRVIADVQAVLQQQGYYKGEVDGLLGPLTRQALTAYQSDNGLYTTAAIDEPTLSSLGMG